MPVKPSAYSFFNRFRMRVSTSAVDASIDRWARAASSDSEMCDRTRRTLGLRIGYTMDRVALLRRLLPTETTLRMDRCAAPLHADDPFESAPIAARTVE